MPESMREVHLPLGLCEAAEQRFSARFGNLEEFLIFVLRELVRDDAAHMDHEEQRIVEERLKDLGYI
jgi:hypothetical protein